MVEPVTERTPEIDLRPDGTAILALASGKVTLRRATIGELRVLEEALTWVADAVTDAWQQVPLAPKRPAERGGDPEEFVRLRKEYREAVQGFTVESQRHYVGWFRQVVEMLGNGAALPENDTDLPPWVSVGEFGARLLAHWTTVPLPVATR